MATVTPSGILSEPVANLRDLLAASETFQAWVSAASAEAAKASIYLAPVNDFAWPFAAIEYGPQAGWMRRQVGVPEVFRSRGTLDLMFQAQVPEEYRDDDQQADARFWFSNRVGDCISDMEELQAGGGYFALSEVKLEILQRTDPEDRRGPGGQNQDVYTCILNVPFGL